MHRKVDDGDPLRQAPIAVAAGCSPSPRSTILSTATPALLDAKQAAAVLNISERKFHELRNSVAWLPRPIALGPRLLRWSRVELEAAVAEAPRATGGNEPASLAAGRRKWIEDTKAGR